MKTKRPDSAKQPINSGTENSLTCQADSSQYNPSLPKQAPTKIPACQRAIVFAVQEIGTKPKKLYAVMAPKQAFEEVRVTWHATRKFIRKFENPLRSQEEVYICVPSSEEKDEDHLPLKDYTLR